MPGGVSHTSPRVDGVGGCEPPPALLLPQKWRPFCLQFEGVVEDFNYGTLLRLDCRGGYSPENTIFGTETPSGGLLGIIPPPFIHGPGWVPLSPIFIHGAVGYCCPLSFICGPSWEPASPIVTRSTGWVPLSPVLYPWAQLGASIPHPHPWDPLGTRISPILSYPCWVPASPIIIYGPSWVPTFPIVIHGCLPSFIHGISWVSLSPILYLQHQLGTTTPRPSSMATDGFQHPPSPPSWLPVPPVLYPWAQLGTPPFTPEPGLPPPPTDAPPPLPATRIQFFAIEIARNREGHNSTIYNSSQQQRGDSK